MNIKLQKLALLMVVALVLAGILACDIGPKPTKPTLSVTSPPSGTKVQDKLNLIAELGKNKVLTEKTINKIMMGIFSA